MVLKQELNFGLNSEHNFEAIIESQFDILSWLIFLLNKRTSLAEKERKDINVITRVNQSVLIKDC